MRSGLIRCLAPCSLSTPFTRMVAVPAPSIFAPMAINRAARSTDLRLPGAIFHQRFALSQNRSHQQVFRAGDGDFVENDVSAMQPFRASFQIPVLLQNGRAHQLPAL